MFGVILFSMVSSAEAGTLALDISSELRPSSEADPIPSLGLRYGQEVDLKAARFTPELGLKGVSEIDYLGAFGGARLSFGRVIEPGIYGHVGYGGRWGTPGWLTADGGVALDLVLARLRVGLHGGAEIRTSQDGPERWLNAGLHTAVRF